MPSKMVPGPFDCMSAALLDEEYFVLLARDPMAPWLLAIWASVRVGDLRTALLNFESMIGEGLLQHFKDNPDQGKSEEAIACAQRMRQWRERNLGLPGQRPTWRLSPTERPTVKIHRCPAEPASFLPDETDGDCS